MWTDLRALVATLMAIGALTAFGAQDPAPTSHTTPISFDYPGFSGFWLQDSRVKPTHLIPSVFNLHNAVRQEIPDDYMTVYFPAHKAEWSYAAESNMTGTEIRFEHYGSGMYMLGSATASPTSSEPIAVGTYLGELAYMGSEQVNQSIYVRQEWLDRGRIFECNNWPQTNDVFKKYKFFIAENLTTLWNVTGMGIVANITTKVPPPESGRLKATRRVSLLDEKGSLSNNPMLRFGDEGLYRPKIFNFKTGGNEIMPARYVHTNETSTIDIMVPANTSALQINGATGYDATVTLTLLSTGQSWENTILPTVFYTRGSESALWFAPLNPAERYNVTIRGGIHTPPVPELQGGDFSSIDLWSFDEDATEDSTLGPSSSMSFSSAATVYVTPTAPVISNKKYQKTNVGAIAGGVVGGVIGLTLLALLGFFLWRRNRQMPKKSSFDMLDSGVADSAPPTPPLHNSFTPYPSAPAAFPARAAQETTQHDSHLAPAFVSSSGDPPRLPPLMIKPDNPFGSGSTMREALPESATTASSYLMPNHFGSSPVTGSGSYSSSEAVPTTEVAFEDDAGQLQPITVPSPARLSPVAILPPNYDPQWAEDARQAAQDSGGVNVAAPARKS